MKGINDCLTRSKSLGEEDTINRHLRVLLVDNNELVRHRLQCMLESEEDMELVGQYASAEEAFSQLGRLSPDVIIMDTRLPGVSRIEATSRLKRDGLHCDEDVILLAESNDYLVEALKARAASYHVERVQRRYIKRSGAYFVFTKGEGMVARFLSKYADTRLKTNLLFFWSRYPCTKFTLGVVAHTLGYARRADIEKALEVLVAAELIEKHTQQGPLFYCLTTDSQKQKPILDDMAKN